MKKCVVVSDSFKGTLSSLEICDLARTSIPRFFPQCQVVTLPVADGGEGTVACFLQALQAQLVEVTVTGPWGETVQAGYARSGTKAVVEMASAAGLLLIYSATRYDADLQGNVTKQALFIAMGVVAYIVVTFVDVEFLLEKWWKVFLLLGLFVILLIQPFGQADNTGNKSWVFLPGIPFGFQPGEIAKLAFVVVLAWLLNHERARGVSRLGAILKYLFLTCVYAGLLAVLSGDFGMVLVYLFLFVIMAWVGGVNKWWFIGVGVPLVAAVAILWNFVLPHTGLWGDYRILRFRVVLDHDLDPLGVGWHQSRSLLAIGSGQLTGMGFLQGKQTQSLRSDSLPARHTDFIFAVCGEEFGLFGCCVLRVLLLQVDVVSNGPTDPTDPIWPH